MSIRPNYVDAILRGDKRYEFRRVIFARPVDIVMVYATAPHSRVVAEFDVERIVTEPIGELWKRTRWSAGLDEQTFFRYFEGKQQGHAIQIGEVRRYSQPFPPLERFRMPPPQSFAYVDRTAAVPQAIPARQNARP